MTTPLDIFTKKLASLHTRTEGFAALGELAEAALGVKLFTVMTVDFEADVARRAYSNMPEAYPVSGDKPMTRNSWFDLVHIQKKSFVANTIKDIADVFPDHDVIASLGCGSVLNIPIFVKDELQGTLNLLDVEQYFTPEKVAEAEALLRLPAIACYLLDR